jgi:hypothetical protein
MLLQDVKMRVISVEFIPEPGKYFFRPRFYVPYPLPTIPLFHKKNDIANGSTGNLIDLTVKATYI